LPLDSIGALLRQSAAPDEVASTAVPRNGGESIY
jgi:hypothetical protein